MTIRGRAIPYQAGGQAKAVRKMFKARAAAPASPVKARRGRFARVIPLVAVSVSGGPGGGGAVPLVLPAAWQAAAVGAAGYIGPVSAQLAIIRGAAVVYSAGGLTIGGAQLIGPAGKVFAFSSSSAAALWVAINRQRGENELTLAQAMTAEALAVFVADKNAAMQKIAAAVVAAAARQANASIKAAMIAEAGWCLEKWA